MAALLKSRVVLAGPGRAGRAFARSWIAAGGRIAFVVVRSAGATPPRIPGAPEVPADEVGKTPETRDCDVLVVAVSDDAIEGLAASLSPRLSCRVALHLSGALSGRALAPLAERGAAVGSLHPVRPCSGMGWRAAIRSPIA